MAIRATSRCQFRRRDVVEITGATGSSPTPSVFVAPGSGGLEFPTGVVWQNGSLYVIDLGAFDGAGKVLTYDSSGDYLGTFVPAGDGYNFGDLEGQYPSDGVFDAQGNLLTANLGSEGPTTRPPNVFMGSIYEYSSSGNFISYPTPSGGLVDSSQFPSTGPASGYSGIVPSQLSYLPAYGITVAGTLTPGSSSSPGILSTGDVSFGSNSTFSDALNGTAAGTGFGQLDSTGTVNLNGATLDVTLGYSPAIGDQFDIVTDSNNAVVGQFAGLPEGATFALDGHNLQITYVGGSSGFDVVLTVVPTTFNWVQTAPGAYNWNDPANWGGIGFPNYAGDVANLATALTGNETISLNQAITVGTIDMGSTGTSGTFTIVANSGSLTLHASSGSAVLDDQNNGGDSINSPITLASNLASQVGGRHRWRSAAPLQVRARLPRRGRSNRPLRRRSAGSDPVGHGHHCTDAGFIRCLVLRRRSV